MVPACRYHEGPELSYSLVYDAANVTSRSSFSFHHLWHAALCTPGTNLLIVRTLPQDTTTNFSTTLQHGIELSRFPKCESPIATISRGVDSVSFIIPWEGTQTARTLSRYREWEDCEFASSFSFIIRILNDFR